MRILYSDSSNNSEFEFFICTIRIFKFQIMPNIPGIHSLYNSIQLFEAQIQFHLIFKYLNIPNA